jgi:hypothetical protein
MLRPLALLALLAALSACTTGATRGGARPTATGALANAASGPSATPRRTAPPETEADACANAPVLLPGEVVRATTSAAHDLFHASCAYGAASPDAVYTFHLAQPARVSLRVSGSYDTVVYVRSACADPDSELACNDDSTDIHHSAVDATLPAGDYYAFVDGYASGNRGFYTLSLATSPAGSGPVPPRIARVRPGEGATVTHTPGQSGVTGAVVFAKRAYTPHGLTRGTVDVAAPHFVVEAVGEGERVLASTETDDRGEFRLEVPAAASVRVRVLSRTAYLGNDIRVVSDPGTERPYEVSTETFRVAGDERIALRAGIGGVEPAGAFNILTQFVRYLPYVQRGFNRPLPSLYAFWRRGNNRTLPQGTITAFLLDYHRHPQSYSLQIQGGEPGREDMSDSDQFDDPVILHEFTHFIVHTMAGHYTIGGIHQDGELHFPGQALDEGAATAMGCAITGDGHYWDTAGLEPNGSILVDQDMETRQLPDRGIGSQNSVELLLWDLMDGAENLPDRDNDGVAIGLSGLMRIYASFRDDATAFPALHTVLARAVELNLVTAQQATRITRHPTDHGFSYPVPIAERWPLDLALPGEAQGRVDGQSQPAPSGGRNIPWNGLDAIRTYRIVVPRRQVLTLRLEIMGPGTQATGTDLALYLYTRNLQPLARSEHETPTEEIARMVDPGTYIVMVRDGDVVPGLMRYGTPGNRADFVLRAR